MRRSADRPGLGRLRRVEVEFPQRLDGLGSPAEPLERVGLELERRAVVLLEERRERVDRGLVGAARERGLRGLERRVTREQGGRVSLGDALELALGLLGAGGAGERLGAVEGRVIAEARHAGERRIAEQRDGRRVVPGLEAQVPAREAGESGLLGAGEGTLDAVQFGLGVRRGAQLRPGLLLCRGRPGLRIRAHEDQRQEEDGDVDDMARR